MVVIQNENDATHSDHECLVAAEYVAYVIHLTLHALRDVSNYIWSVRDTLQARNTLRLALIAHACSDSLIDYLSPTVFGKRLSFPPLWPTTRYFCFLCI